MIPSCRRPARLSNAWLVPGTSLVAIAVLVFLLWNTGRRSRPGDELVVYCATGMVKPVEEAAREYERTYGTKIIIEADGSGKLLNTKVRVVKHRGDLFVAADASYIVEGQADGLLAEAIGVARIHPVIATAPGNPKKITSVRDLLRDDVKVALANPENASIGRVSKKALGGTWAELERQQRDFRAKVSLVGTVNEVAQAVQVGAADAGIVWDITARGYGLEIVETPALQRTEEQVTLGVLQRTEQPQRALHFARFLTARDRGLTYFAKHQFQLLPDSDVWAEEPRIVLFCGASLSPAIEPTLQEFERREGVHFELVADECSNLPELVKARSPAFLLAGDAFFLREVQDDFLPPVELAVNDAVILVAKGNPLGIKNLADLARDDDQNRSPEVRVGLGHPTDSTLGRLTRRLLENQRLLAQLVDSGNVVGWWPSGDDLVKQLAHGELDAVVVYRSNVPATADLDLIAIRAPGARSVQAFAVARNSEHQHLLRRLQSAIEGPKSRQRFEQLGFRWLERREKP